MQQGCLSGNKCLGRQHRQLCNVLGDSKTAKHSIISADLPAVLSRGGFLWRVCVHCSVVISTHQNSRYADVHTSMSQPSGGLMAAASCVCNTTAASPQHKRQPGMYVPFFWSNHLLLVVKGQRGGGCGDCICIGHHLLQTRITGCCFARSWCSDVPWYVTKPLHRLSYWFCRVLANL